jgi:ketosteroid isomerase-like protein
MNIEQIAKRLVELCRKGEHEKAQRELYADDAVSVEAPGSPQGALGDVKGLPAILEKGHKFQAMLEQVHGSEVSDAVIGGNWFAISMTLDATMKERGRVNMKEICVYQVRNGKIASERFFYDLG